MYAIYEDTDGSKMSSEEEYEKSVLAPLRRRLSDARSTSTAIDTSATTSTSILPNVELYCIGNENDRNSIISKYDKNGRSCEKIETPDLSSQSQPTKKLKSCLSVPHNKKRQRSSITSPITLESNLSCAIHDESESPNFEPSRKRCRYSNSLHQSIVQLRNDQLPIPLTSRKAVHFAPSSAVEYEGEVPVSQSLTPIPAETANRRYPTEMKAVSMEETELIQITKQNNAILKAFDDMYDSDNNDNNGIIRRRKKKKYQAIRNRRKSFYIPSTSSHYTSSGLESNQSNDSILNTI